MTTPPIPILRAYVYNSAGHLDVWCKYCWRWHYHSSGDGHRFAHCSYENKTPYSVTGYILRRVDGPKPIMPRSPPGAPRNWRQRMQMGRPWWADEIVGDSVAGR